MSLGSKLADLVPGQVVRWVHDHPQILVILSSGLVAYHVFALVDAIGLYHRAKAFVGDIQREASEALGG